MANILIVGGGFDGVAAAESPAKKLGPEHQITLISRSRQFIFHPALVRLAFGKNETGDISFDLRGSMVKRGVRFVQGEVARVDPYRRRVTIARGEVEGEMPYDYLIFALGGRPATERVTGFFEHARHPLTVEAALRLGETVRNFRGGRAVIGYSPEAWLTVPVYETAFTLSRLLEERGERGRAQITVVSPEPQGEEFAGREMGQALRDELKAHRIDLLTDFPVNRVTAKSALTGQGDRLDYDLLMLLPPVGGASAVRGMGITDHDGFIRVDGNLRVRGVEGMYAVGNCVNFPGPKMGFMAASQGMVAAANIAAEVEGREPDAKYEHGMTPVVNRGGHDALYLHRRFWGDDRIMTGLGRFMGELSWHARDTSRSAHT